MIRLLTQALVHGDMKLLAVAIDPRNIIKETKKRMLRRNGLRCTKSRRAKEQDNISRSGKKLLFVQHEAHNSGTLA